MIIFKGNSVLNNFFNFSRITKKPEKRPRVKPPVLMPRHNENAVDSTASKQYTHSQKQISPSAIQQIQTPKTLKPVPQTTASYNIFRSAYSRSKGKKLIQQLPSTKEMVILREIMAPPKGVGQIRQHEFWG